MNRNPTFYSIEKDARVSERAYSIDALCRNMFCVTVHKDRRDKDSLCVSSNEVSLLSAV